MYFSSIDNLELKYFHKIFPHNFNMSLTDVLSSDLFYIETIIPSKLYRISLLFYCNKIISSNPDDAILENKCIICNKTSEETYFNFISDENDNYILNNLTGYYSIEDELSDEDYNSIVQLLRVNNTFSEDIQIDNSSVVGEYGTYVFNLESTTIIDTGVLITNETLSSIGTVKLFNPTFKNSNYKLKLTVYTLSDVNICNDSSNGNISETELIIDLIEDSEVNIPFNTLDLNCIVGFDAVITVTHDLPVISETEKEPVYLRIRRWLMKENAEIEGIIYSTHGSPLSNVPITIIWKENDNEIEYTTTTSDDGVFSASYSNAVNLTAIYICYAGDESHQSFVSKFHRS